MDGKTKSVGSLLPQKTKASANNDRLELDSNLSYDYDEDPQVDPFCLNGGILDKSAPDCTEQFEKSSDDDYETDGS